jgi:hypothetical protein
LPDIRQPFPRTRYIRSHSTFAIFEKNVTHLDTFARVIRHFGKFGASGHCLVFTQKVSVSIQEKKLCQHYLKKSFHLSDSIQKGIKTKMGGSQKPTLPKF